MKNIQCELANAMYHSKQCNYIFQQQHKYIDTQVLTSEMYQIHI